MAQLSNKFAIYITGGRLLSMLAGFIMPVVLVRIMSKENYGLTSQFLTLYTSIYTIVAMGVHTNIFFFCPSVDKEESDRYVANTLFFLLLFGLLSGLVMSIPVVKDMLFGNSELGKYSDLIILSISMASVVNIVSPLNTIWQDKWGALFFPAFIAFGQIGTILFSTLYFDDIYQTFFLLFIYQCVILAVILFYITVKVRLVLDFSLMKEQLVYSLPFGFAVALQLFSNYFDKFVCIRMLTPADYAIYGIAFLSIPGISQIYDSLCQVNIVNMSNSFRCGRIEEILPQYGNFVIKTLSFSVPVIFVVSLYAEEIMSFLYTSSYVAAAPFFRLYSLTFLASMFGAGTILRSMGKTKMSLYAFLITCILGLPSTYFLVTSFGTSGAIWGAFINIMLPRFIQMGFEIYVTRCGLLSFLPWKKIFDIFVVSIVLLIPLFALKMIVSQHIVVCIALGAVYVLLVYMLLLQKDLFIVDKKKISLMSKKTKLWKS